MIKKLVASTVISLILLSSSMARGSALGESNLQAATILAEDTISWIDQLTDKPASVALFQVRATSPVSQEYAQLIESELLRASKKASSVAFTSCLECRVPQVKVDGDNLVITKGMPDPETVKSLGVKTGAKSFLVLDLFRTNYSVYAEATLINARNAEVISVNQIRVPAFEIGESSLLFMLHGGIGRILGPTVGGLSIPYSINISALEELGFGKGGLTLGGIFAGQNGNLGYAVPTLGLRTQFGATPVHALASIGAGFGYAGSKAGAALRASYDLFLGSFTSLGVDAAYLIPVSGLVSGTSSALNGYIGLHLGVSIGR